MTFAAPTSASIAARILVAPGTLSPVDPCQLIVQPPHWLPLFCALLPVSATLQANTAYWLVYNTNGTRATLNNLVYSPVSGMVGAYANTAQPFGSWPASFGSSSLGGWQYSLYATVSP